MINKIIFKSVFLVSISINMAAKHVSVQDIDITKQLDMYLHELTKLGRFSGSVVVAQGNNVLLNKGYGCAHHEFEIPNSPQIKFKICSITKMITATAILQLQERGLLHINDPINKYLDYPRGHEITIHHLLTHTSGIASCNLPYNMVVCPINLASMIDFFKNQQMEYEPGSNYRYNNAGYFILSFIIEKISGKSYESFIKETILDPLAMKDSSFSEYDYAILKNCVSGYCRNDKNNLVHGHYIYDANSKGAGSLYCTAYDLYKFVKALCDGHLINKASLQAMFTAYSDEENYGYGCHINQLMGHKIIEHGGMLSSGFKSNVSVFVDKEIYIIILSNYLSSWVNEARDTLAAIVLKQPYNLPCSDAIKLDFDLYDEYAGIYDHPLYKSGYNVERKGNKLYIPENIEIYPVAKDQFMALNQNADNIVYTFMRNEKGQVSQLRIKGGGPYFEVGCEKKGQSQ